MTWKLYDVGFTLRRQLSSGHLLLKTDQYIKAVKHFPVLLILWHLTNYRIFKWTARLYNAGYTHPTNQQCEILTWFYRFDAPSGLSLSWIYSQLSHRLVIHCKLFQAPLRAKNVYFSISLTQIHVWILNPCRKYVTMKGKIGCFIQAAYTFNF